MSDHPTSWCSNCCRSWAAAAASFFLSSLGAHAAVGALSAYAATKGAIDMLVNWPRRLGVADLKRAAAARPTVGGC